MESRGTPFTSPSDREVARIYQDLLLCLSPGSSFSDADVQELIQDPYWKLRDSPEMSASDPPKICVVGAGVAGLRCADVLTQRGFNVTVIEARDRVGGRLHQAKLPNGHLIDLGPNWIHGTEHNPIQDIAIKLGCETQEFEEHENFFDEDGNFIEDGAQLSFFMWEMIGEAFEFSRKNTDTIKASATLYNWFKQKVLERFSDENESRRKKILLQMIHLWGAFVASKVETQSLKFLWMEEVIEGQNLFCSETYKKIVEYIAKPALDSCKVMMSTKITNVSTFEDSVSVSTNRGDTLKFDEVVFTAPLGWLKKNSGNTFSPPLPRRLLEAINNIGYGNLEKVYITFPRAFWLGSESSPDEKPMTGFVQWLSPRYAKASNWNKWEQEAVDLSTMSGSHAQPTLLFYLYGEQVIALSDKLAGVPDEARSKYLIKYFKPYYSILPHYAESSSDCAPVYALYTDWTADDLAGNGSYTTLRKGVEEADVDIEIMREGLPGRSLWFCGEHTAPVIAYGTVTGAYWSGEHVAERIAKVYPACREKLVEPLDEKDVLPS